MSGLRRLQPQDQPAACAVQHDSGFGHGHDPSTAHEITDFIALRPWDRRVGIDECRRTGRPHDGAEKAKSRRCRPGSGRLRVVLRRSQIRRYVASARRRSLGRKDVVPDDHRVGSSRGTSASSSS
jgi:hypothetical protein